MSDTAQPKQYARPTGSSLAYRGDVLVGWYCDSCDTLYTLADKVCKHCLDKSSSSLEGELVRLLTEDDDD